jgi:hypothetical protein
MAECITCGAQLHPDRARKYNYCTAAECQQQNAKGLTMVAIGMNKAAEEFLILDESTREDLASGKYRDQRRTSFGTSAAAAPAGKATDAGGATGAARATDAAGATGAAGATSAGRPVRSGQQRQPARRRPPRAPAPPWTPKQQRLALLYNEQGLRPAEIASKLGVSSYLVTQIILAAKNRGKL